jgi:hypothetical protein
MSFKNKAYERIARHFYYKVDHSFLSPNNRGVEVLGVGRLSITFSLFAWLCWFTVNIEPTQISAPHPRKTTRLGRCLKDGKTMPQMLLPEAFKMQNFFDFLQWVLFSFILSMIQLRRILFSLTLSFLSLT